MICNRKQSPLRFEAPNERRVPMSPARPRPVYAPDTPLSELRAAELLVVSSLRLWILPYTAPTERHPDWRVGFRRAGLSDAGVDGFDALFRIVASAALRSLDVRCPRCARLGEDEAWLLQLGCVLQRRHFSEAAAILGNWLPPAALRIAVAPAERFAVGLAASGLHLPCRHAEAATVRLLAPEAHAARGLTLVQSNDETRAIPDRAAAAPTPYRHDIAAEIPPSAGGRCCRTRATS